MPVMSLTQKVVLPFLISIIFLLKRTYSFSIDGIEEGGREFYARKNINEERNHARKILRRSNNSFKIKGDPIIFCLCSAHHG
jgi:hypothetical protein